MTTQAELIDHLQIELLRVRTMNPRYSLRAYAKKLGIHPSALSEIFSGKRRITKRLGEKVLEKLPIDPTRAALIRSTLKNRISPLKGKTSRLHRQWVELSVDQYHLISDWHYYAILSLAETQDFAEDPLWIAQRLNLTNIQAKNAIKRLKRLNLLPLRSDGTGPISFKTRDGVTDLAIQASHHQHLDLARDSLMRDPIEHRDFSGMTMAIDPARLPEAKARIQQFRRDLCDFLEGGEKKEVFRIALQLFPLTEVLKGI